MTRKLALAAILAAFVMPGAAVAMCSGGHQKVVDCAQGETRDPGTGQCMKQVVG